ncbi:hypothetical protein BGZ90_011068 [Linnemannia elongata]|nr:hypothetical protein BGZ90_011068 [Linnemannia elongata]
MPGIQDPQLLHRGIILIVSKSSTVHQQEISTSLEKRQGNEEIGCRTGIYEAPFDFYLVLGLGDTSGR